MTSLQSFLRKVLFVCGAAIAAIALRAAFGLASEPGAHPAEWFICVFLDAGASALLAGFCFSFAAVIREQDAGGPQFEARLLKARAFLVQYAGALLLKSGALLALLVREGDVGFRWWMINNATTELTEVFPLIAAACVLVELVRECSDLRDEQERTV